MRAFRAEANNFSIKVKLFASLKVAKQCVQRTAGILGDNLDLYIAGIFSAETAGLGHTSRL
jgi:hypothetical protein